MAIQSKSREKLITFKNKVSDEVTTSALVGGAAILATTTGSLPIYDEKGTLLGYVALFDTANLL